MAGKIALQDIKTILEIYYQNPGELRTAEIKKLFGVKSTATVHRLKNEVRKAQLEAGVKTWAKDAINTEIAFKVWGIDVQELERKYQRAQELGI